MLTGTMVKFDFSDTLRAKYIPIIGNRTLCTMANFNGQYVL